MFELFPDQPVYEYPTIVNVLYSMVWAFILSSLIAITHRLTYPGAHYPKNFFQALALGSIVSAMVMMAIGDSLARGLGAFGALAIIRFRTRIQDARNILFIFASLSVGLAIGVFGYTIAFMGTILFCVMALLLHISPFSTKNGVKGRLQIRLSNIATLPTIKSILDEYCLEYQDMQIVSRASGAAEYEFFIEIKKDVENETLIAALQKIEPVTRVRVTYKDMVEEN